MYLISCQSIQNLNLYFSWPPIVVRLFAGKDHQQFALRIEEGQQLNSMEKTEYIEGPACFFFHSLISSVFKVWKKKTQESEQGFGSSFILHLYLKLKYKKSIRITGFESRFSLRPTVMEVMPGSYINPLGLTSS